jgi:hypothetical protein
LLHIDALGKPHRLGKEFSFKPAELVKLRAT